MEREGSLKTRARLAGLLWLLSAVTGGFGLFYIRSYVLVPADAATTVSNITSVEFLFRAAIVGTLLSQVFLFFFGISLFQLFKAVNKRLATVLLAAVMMTVGLAVINQINNLGALLLLNQPDFLKVFSPEQFNAMALFLIRQANGSGQGLLEIFWTPYYFSFGLLIIRSGFLPKIMGIMLMIMSVGFAVNILDKFLVPQFYPAAFTQMAMTLGALGVLPTMLWLLLMGAKESINDRDPSA